MIETEFVARHYRHYSGWIKVWRQIFNNDLWHSCPHSWFRVFFAILGCANYEDTELRVGGQTIIVSAGSLIIGTIEFSTFCGVSRQQLRSALEYLEEKNMVTTCSTTRYTLVKVCNWESYQEIIQAASEADNQQNNQPNNQPVASPITTNKEVKNTKKNTLTALKEHPLVIDLAEKVHARHPARRRGSLSEVKLQIAKILASRSEESWLTTCEEINSSHVVECSQFGWQKEDGEYAKGLVNWLAPTMGRWQSTTTRAMGAAVGSSAPKKLMM